MCTSGDLFEQLNKLRSGKTVIVGVGNTLKGDDGIGPLVCERLAGRVSAELMNAGTAPENYIQPIIKKAPQNLIIIDAIDFKASPGTISIFEPEQLDLIGFSTHVISPKLFIDMICRSIKVNVCLIGIQPAQTTLGQQLSHEISEAVKQLTDILVEVFTIGK